MNVFSEYVPAKIYFYFLTMAVGLFFFVFLWKSARDRLLSVLAFFVFHEELHGFANNKAAAGDEHEVVLRCA